MGSLNSILRAVISHSNAFLERLTTNEAVLKLELESYESIISRYFEYFNELDVEARQRFLLRVYRFKKGKKFHFIGLPPADEIPILISAAAVQITFGLRKYRMSFFKNIFIMAYEYTYGFSQVPWAGHVNRNGIYISWKHFLRGYSQNADSYNLALHEMAHALEYVNFGDYFRADSHFVNYFHAFKKLAESTIVRSAPTSSLLSEAAMKNFHECWAECVELFFENPSGLHADFPEIYQVIKSLLNQDPLNKRKIVQPALAS